MNTHRCIGVFIEAHVHVHTFVASLEGGLHVARDFFRQRSASDERMLITTVRLSGWWGLFVLNSDKDWSRVRTNPAHDPNPGLMLVAYRWPPRGAAR